MKTNLSVSETRGRTTQTLSWFTSGLKRLSQHKTVMTLSVSMALQATAYVIVVPLFALRFRELGAGASVLGTSVMAGAAAGAVAAPLVGTMADRYGRRLIVVISLAVYTFSFIGFLLATSPLTLILLRALASALSISMLPVVIGIVATIAPADRRAQWIGFISGGTSVGWIAGPILGGLLYDHWGYGIAVTASLLMAFASLVIAVVALPEIHHSQARTQKESLECEMGQNRQLTRSPNVKSAWRVFRSALPGSLTIFTIMLLIYFLVMFAWTFIEPSFMFFAYEDLGWNSSMLGLVMSTYGIALMLGELGLGRLSDRLGRKPVIVLGTILFSAQFIGLAFFRNYLWIAVSFVIAGLGNALFDPALSASLLDITPRQHQARTQGIRSAIGSIGSMLGSALAILAASLLSAQTIFLAAAGASLMAATVGLLAKLKHMAALEKSAQAVKAE